VRACKSSKKKGPRAVEHEMNHDKKGTYCQKINAQLSFDFREYGKFENGINSYHRHRLFEF
jgi:hypothetical protein